MDQILSDGVNADYDDPDLKGYTHPIEPIIAMDAQSGPDIPLSVSDAMKRSTTSGSTDGRHPFKRRLRASKDSALGN